MNDNEKSRIYQDFNKAVNMRSYEIEAFLKTDDSKKVGQTIGDNKESIGRQSAKRIITILGKKKSELTDSDYDHMKRVISYVARHKAQGGPNDDKRHSKWRYSLMNWGHDPLK